MADQILTIFIPKWVGVSEGPDLTGAAIKRPSLSTDEQSCIKGTAPVGFREMCEFTCQYG